MIIKNFRHCGIETKNLNKSLWFYKELLGLKIIKKMKEDKKLMSEILKVKNCNLTTIKLGVKKKIILELLYFKNLNQKMNKIDIYSLGLTHVSLTVKDIRKMYNKLSKHKIKFFSKPTLSSDKKVMLCFCKTPENIFLELVEIL